MLALFYFVLFVVICHADPRLCSNLSFLLSCKHLTPFLRTSLFVRKFSLGPFDYSQCNHFAVLYLILSVFFFATPRAPVF